MSEAGGLTPTEYIGHHLTNRTVSLGDSPFWTLHLDTFLTAVALGIVGFGFLWWVMRGVTAGVPNSRQAFVELLGDFVDDQVKGIFHGEPRFRRAARADGVCVGAVDERDGFPAGRSRRGLYHPRAAPARMEAGADRRREYHLRAGVVGAGPDDLLQSQSQRCRRLDHELFCTPFG